MTRLVAVPLGYLINGIYNVVDNYGISIILMTILIRIIILPLYSMQLKSSEQMMLVQPKVKEIQTKYKDTPEKMQEKLQELYQEHNIKPAMGCLPLLIQLPIIWGLFGLLRNPMTYISNSDMVLAVHESFLWVDDLSQPDLWILPIIAGVATFVSMKITTGMQSGANNPANASMKAMQYFMPVMIVWMGRTLPAGLCMYWVMSYIFQIVQTKVIQIRKKVKERKNR
ncbi:MAG: YidC/Oxa1 family membrane protein insertase [Anaerovoracaceae bacterium]